MEKKVEHRLPQHKINFNGWRNLQNDNGELFNFRFYAEFNKKYIKFTFNSLIYLGKINLQ